MLILIGIPIIAIGFLIGLNPLLVVTIAAFATGWAAGLDPIAVLAAFGKAFNDNRFVSAVWILLPAIGLLERYGLQERARALIGALRGATTGRLLLAYMVFRQLTAAIGLHPIAGHPQTVRPLVAPMAEAAAELRDPALSASARDRVKAWAAATDNIGLFFGEDIFMAIASILLIKGFMAQSGIFLQPLQLSLWAIPTAIAALLIHGARLMRLDRRIAEGRLR